MFLLLKQNYEFNADNVAFQKIPFHIAWEQAKMKRK